MNTHETRLNTILPRLAVAALAFSTATAMADPVEWPTSGGGNGHEYEVVLTPSGMGWSDARAAAEAAGGHLATVSSMAELDFINSLDFSGTSKGWIGGYQDTSAADYEEPYGGWRWVTGEPWSFVGWWEDAPSSSPTRNFVQLAYTQCQDEIDVANEGEWYVVEYDNPAAMQWSGNGHWYEFIPVDRGWDLHNDEALARGAHMVTITSAAEGQIVELVRDTADSEAAFHTGGYQDPAAPDFSEPAGGWRWITGEPFQYTNWGYSDGDYQPNNDGGTQNRIGIRWQENEIWMDVNHTTEWYGMIEWSADCNGDGIVDYGQILDGSLNDANGNGVPDCCDDGSCQIITVAQDGSGDFTTVQEAIDFASSGATINVSPGTYVTNLDALGKSLTLVGLAGSEFTILDGSNSGSVLRAVSGSGATISLTGFAIRHGSGTNFGGYIHGGGICVSNHDLTLASCSFHDNAARYGGGVYLEYGNLSITDCQLMDNTVTRQGGGVATHHAHMQVNGSSFSSNSCSENIGGAIACALHGVGSLAVSNSSFTGNYAGEAGGAIETHAAGDGVTITGCQFTDNVTSNGGAIRIGDVDFTCSDSVFTSNLATVYTSGQSEDGGAICIFNNESGDTPVETLLEVTNCSFISNVAVNGAFSMRNVGGSPLIQDCLFEANEGLTPDPNSGGAALKFIKTAGLVNSCEFKENRCPNNGNSGSAIKVWHPQSVVSYQDSDFCGHEGQPLATWGGGSFQDLGGNDFSDTCSCTGDVDNDGVVNVNDVLVVLAEYGTTNPLGDANGDGIVDVNDVLIVVASWGPCQG